MRNIKINGKINKNRIKHTNKLNVFYTVEMNNVEKKKKKKKRQTSRKDHVLYRLNRPFINCSALVMSGAFFGFIPLGAGATA